MLCDLNDEQCAALQKLQILGEELFSCVTPEMVCIMRSHSPYWPYWLHAPGNFLSETRWHTRINFSWVLLHEKCSSQLSWHLLPLPWVSLLDETVLTLTCASASPQDVTCQTNRWRIYELLFYKCFSALRDVHVKKHHHRSEVGWRKNK